MWVGTTALRNGRGTSRGLEHSGKVSARSFGCGSGPLSSSMDSELGGAQVRLESETSSRGMGVGTSAIRIEIMEV